MKKHECLDDEAEWVDENLYHDNWPFLSPEQNRNTDHVRYVRNLWASCVDEKLENPEWNPLAEIRGAHLPPGQSIERHCVAEAIRRARTPLMERRKSRTLTVISRIINLLKK